MLFIFKTGGITWPVLRTVLPDVYTFLDVTGVVAVWKLCAIRYDAITVLLFIRVRWVYRCTVMVTTSIFIYKYCFIQTTSVYMCVSCMVARHFMNPNPNPDPSAAESRSYWLTSWSDVQPCMQHSVELGAGPEGAWCRTHVTFLILWNRHSEDLICKLFRNEFPCNVGLKWLSWLLCSRLCV